MRQIFFLIPLFFSSSLFASFPGFFGPSSSTSRIGNQANHNLKDPANFYYVPALLGQTENLSLSANISSTVHDFTPIQGIVTKNSTVGESGTDTTLGSVNTDYEDANNVSIHLALPLKTKYLKALGINFFSPIGSFAETNSGDPNLPEYSLYRSRYRRTQIHFNFGVPLSDNFFLSFGAHVGFQVAARVNTQVSLSDNYGSNGSAKTQIEPSLAGILSFAYKKGNDISYVTFQQEMKSNLDAIATGDISDPPLTLINIGLESMIYYDPHILRIGQTLDFNPVYVYMALEYQMWENYVPPFIQVNNLGGTVRASDRFESLTLRNTFNPKIGVQYSVTDKFNLSTGVSFRQSPFDSDFSGAGNTIDSDSFIISAGAGYEISLFGKQAQLGLSVQEHRLKEKTVTKTEGQENGSSGVKIGSPGYNISGSVISASAGINVSF